MKLHKVLDCAMQDLKPNEEFQHDCLDQRVKNSLEATTSIVNLPCEGLRVLYTKKMIVVLGGEFWLQI